MIGYHPDLSAITMTYQASASTEAIWKRKIAMAVYTHLRNIRQHKTVTKLDRLWAFILACFNGEPARAIGRALRLRKVPYVYGDSSGLDTPPFATEGADFDIHALLLSLRQFQV